MKLKNYIKLSAIALTLVSLAACSADELGDTPDQSGNSTKFVVASLPGYAESSGTTRALASDIGVQDPGKTEWEHGDTLMLKVRFFDEAGKLIGRVFAYNLYLGGNWELGDGLSFNLKDDLNLPEAIRDGNVSWPIHAKKMRVEAFYAPKQAFVSDSLIYCSLPEAVGQTPIWKTSTTINTPGEEITLTKWEPACVRIRVAAVPGDRMKFAAPLFEPVGGKLNHLLETATTDDGSGKRPGEPVGFIKAVADKKGNTYFYGSWKSETTFTVSLYESTPYELTETQVFERKLASSLDGSIPHFAINALVGSKCDGINNWNIIPLDETYVGSSLLINTRMNRWIITESEPDYATIIETLEAVHQADPTRSIDLALPLVKIVKAQAFKDCKLLTSISLGAAKEIGAAAFSGCTALTTLNLPELTGIGEQAFEGCTSLQQIYLPKVTIIGEEAFKDCNALTSIKMDMADLLEDRVFENCTQLTSLRLPKMKTLYNYVFAGCSGLTHLTFESVIKECFPNAFDRVNTEKITLTIHHDQPNADEDTKKFNNNWTFLEIKRHQKIE